MTTFDLPDELQKPYFENKLWMVLMVVCIVFCGLAVSCSQNVCMFRSSANKMGVMVRGMTVIESFIATRNRVPLSGKPWSMPFCWGCTKDSWPVTLTWLEREWRLFCRG